jgi:hypothetical protein
MIVRVIDVCGVLLPNVPLSNIQLLEAAKKMQIRNFTGVYLRDELLMKPRDNECGILNLDESSGTGTHWVGWIKKRNEKYYFDGYGLPPPVELLKYLHSPVYYNSERIQPDNEVFCGHLCLYVLKMVGDGMNFQEVINGLH